MTPQELLNNAAALLEEHGHIKYHRGGPETGMCALGALSYATNCTGLADSNPVMREAVKLVVETTPEVAAVQAWSLEGKLATWNNEPERTGDEVTALFKTVASAGAREPEPVG